MGGVANWIRLAADPYSNGIMYSVQDSGRDLNTRYWDGAAWDTAASHPEHDTGTEDTSRNNDIVFETFAANAGRAWLLWGNGYQTQQETMEWCRVGRHSDHRRRYEFGPNGGAPRVRGGVVRHI